MQPYILQDIVNFARGQNAVDHLQNARDMFLHQPFECFCIPLLRSHYILIVVHAISLPFSLYKSIAMAQLLA
jgi:hypothetical protein